MTELLELQQKKQISRLAKKNMNLKKMVKILYDENLKRKRASKIAHRRLRYIQTHNLKLFNEMIEYVNNKYPKEEKND